MRPSVRFCILRRDGFTCRYCGRRPPDVVLHVDHMVPVARGGTSDEDNLITACRRCNLGKSIADAFDDRAFERGLARLRRFEALLAEHGLDEFERHDVVSQAFGDRDSALLLISTVRRIFGYEGPDAERCRESIRLCEEADREIQSSATGAISGPMSSSPSNDERLQ